MYSEDELIRHLRKISGGKPLSAREYQRRVKLPTIEPASRTYIKRFGSWKKALLAAGLEKEEQDPRKKLGEMLEKHVTEAGHVLNLPEYRNLQLKPTSATYFKYFGSWENAYRWIGINYRPSFKSGRIVRLKNKKRTEYFRERERRRRAEREKNGRCPQCGGEWIEPVHSSSGRKPKHCRRCQEYFRQRYKAKSKK